MKAQLYSTPLGVEGRLVHTVGNLAGHTAWTCHRPAVQEVLDAMLSKLANEPADEWDEGALIWATTEFFVDPHGTHKKELQAFEIRLAWETIRGIATYPDEFGQDRHTPSVGMCKHAISEVGPTLKTINTALERGARQVRAVTSALGANIFRLTWQN